MTKVQDTAAGGALIAIAAVVTRIITLFLWFALGVVLLAIPTVALFQGQFMHGIADGLAQNRIIVDPANLAWKIIAILMGAAVTLALTIAFFTLLYRIALTVRAGDPFIARNAERLRSMAWLFLSLEVGSVILGIMARTLLPMAKEGGIDISVTSLVAILALFVLARVFEQGTQMRAEIEGTV
ncbi:DUF2975 domain-containing protein [Sphingomonas sp. FW199]|uniref:DUF2975 domain-containing protein n=1 Tax=Sphingomonas sp. FW199 TaxID=3400217 RepID=UPI003CF6859C